MPSSAQVLKYTRLKEELLELESTINLIKARVIRDVDFDEVLRYNICQMAGGMTQGLGGFLMNIHNLIIGEVDPSGSGPSGPESP